MSNMVDVIVPTLFKSPVFKESLISLKNLPFSHRLFLMGPEYPSWPEAINAGFEKTRNDVLIMDDDVVIGPKTFLHFREDAADMIGFVLRLPDGSVQHSGSFIDRDGIIRHNKKNISDYVSTIHATASLLYIRRHVIDKIGGMSVWDGFQFEDVDFSFRALKAGFAIRVCPGVAVHCVSATKRPLPSFKEKAQRNKNRLYKEHADIFSQPSRFAA